MSEHNPDAYSSTNGSDSIAGSPTESVHSYVRPRPQRVARVTFAPPLLSPASSTTSTSEGFVRPRPRSPQRLSYRPQSRYPPPEPIRIPVLADWDDRSPSRTALTLTLQAVTTLTNIRMRTIYRRLGSIQTSSKNMKAFMRRTSIRLHLISQSQILVQIFVTHLQPVDGTTQEGGTSPHSRHQMPAEGSYAPLAS